MQLNLVDIEHFFELPTIVFLKDRLGKYQESNDYNAQFAGHKKGKDLIGTTDYDHCWRNEANFFQLIDKIVIDQNQPLLFIEDITSAEQNILKILTYKIPTYTRTRKPLVFGMSFFLTRDDSLPEIFQRFRIPFNLSTPSIHKRVNGANLSAINAFSQREMDCLYYLVKGMTAKQIACELGLSKRTVEYYFIILKNKLNCFSKSELIKKALELDFIKAKLL